jgi:hypothetical protein
MDPLNTTSVARAQSAPTTLAPTDDPASEAETLVEASRQVGFVNTAHLAQALRQARYEDPERGASVRDAIDQLLSPLDRASLEQQLVAALPPETPSIQRPRPQSGAPMHVPADAFSDGAIAQHAALRIAQAFEQRGAEHAARTLRELTEGETPALAARILQATKALRSCSACAHRATAAASCSGLRSPRSRGRWRSRCAASMPAIMRL